MAAPCKALLPGLIVHCNYARGKMEERVFQFMLGCVLGCSEYRIHDGSLPKRKYLVLCTRSSRWGT
jgi:hypothetical protein